MKPTHSLYMQTLGMVLFYLVTLNTIAFICFNAQFGIGWESLLKSPAGDRVDTIADAISSNLQGSDPKNWTGILSDFNKLYNVQFYVFDVRGEQLAGKPLTLPKQLKEKIIEFPHNMPLPFEGGFHEIHSGTQLPFGAGFSEFPPNTQLRIGSRFQEPPFLKHDLSYGGQPVNIENQNTSHGEASGWTPARHQLPQIIDGLEAAPGLRQFHPLPFTHAQGRFIVRSGIPDTFFVGTKVILFDVQHMHPIPCYVIAASNNIWQSTLLFDFPFFFAIASSIFLLSLVFWWPFVHQIVQSIGELTAVTEKIAEGNFDARILSNRRDEIGRLGNAVNIMAEKLHEYLFTQKRFLADISHELFSPLARLHMAVDLMENCKPEDVSRHFEEINEEIDEMKSLINELLAYSKAALTKSDRQLVHVDLKPILEEVIGKLPEESQIQISLDANSIVEGDPLLLSRSFSNILRNSVRFAGSAGPITVKTTRANDSLIITFADCGPGVPADTLKYLGQPFFRPEFSRNRNMGGFGLGLAIVKSCVEACNGTVQLANQQTGGLKVEITLKSIS